MIERDKDGNVRNGLITVASEHVNRTLKRAKDAAEWMPDRNTRWFAVQVVHLKRKYGPSIDPAERDALAAFVSCEAERRID